MKKLFIFGLFSILTASAIYSAWALDVSYAKTLKEANTLYSKSQYEAALDKYQKLSLIEPTPEVFYNLGNSYYKTKKLGEAIAAYEKAKLLAPRDSDIRKNLKFAVGSIPSKITDQRDWTLRELDNLFSYFTLIECEIVALALVAVTLVWMIVLLAFGHHPFRGWIIRTFVTLILLSAAGCGLKYYFSNVQTSGVVIRQDAEVRYGPARDEKVVFRLPEGLKIRLLEDREGWERVQLPNNDTGWISKDDLEVIRIA